MYTGQLLLLKKMMPMSEFEGVKITAVDNFQGIYEYVYSAHVCANMLVPCVLVDFCHLATKTIARLSARSGNSSISQGHCVMTGTHFY